MSLRFRTRGVVLLLVSTLLHLGVLEGTGRPPNVILIMTDDQGYGDIGAHGRPFLKTPHLDRLYNESVRWTNFHVSPFCTPTRAALMTGHFPARTGAYRTSSGRTMMHRDERTIADIFASQGYRTGMVGKWHLGDNAPHRPQDRGFQDVVWHRCGGVGQASDYWGNDYFDDTYERNGVFEKFDGYCTDVWFHEARRFVRENRERPFFLYIAPNAPHGPYRVPPEWSAPYRDLASWRAGPEFLGMVANIDHNLGLLREELDELGLAEDTILVFMTDNGTANGGTFQGLDAEVTTGYNAGMRGKKSSVYEGGHRVPFFIHWPNGGVEGGQDVDHLAAHLDVLPTLVDLCGLDPGGDRPLDGRSFAQALRDPKAMPHRDSLVVQFQGGAHFREAPQPWRDTCVIQGPWRLINQTELYHMDEDPAQRRNVADTHPEVVASLREIYAPFWESVSPRMSPVSIHLGDPAEPVARLSSQDWYLPSGNPPWNFGSIGRLPKVTGPWMVDVRRAGRYRVTLRQWPEVAGRAIVATDAKVEIAGMTWERPVADGATGVDFEIDLPAGETTLTTWLTDASGATGGAYFTDVVYLSGDDQ